MQHLTCRSDLHAGRAQLQCADDSRREREDEAHDDESERPAEVDVVGIHLDAVNDDADEHEERCKGGEA